MAAVPVLRDNVAARLLREARERASSALLAVGLATCAAAVSSSPPAEGLVLPRRAWLGALAVALVGSVCTMRAALWVATDAPRRRTAGQIILCAAFVPLAVAVGLGGADPRLVFGILDAMV